MICSLESRTTLGLLKWIRGREDPFQWWFLTKTAFFKVKTKSTADCIFGQNTIGIQAKLDVPLDGYFRVFLTQHLVLLPTTLLQPRHLSNWFIITLLVPFWLNRPGQLAGNSERAHRIFFLSFIYFSFLNMKPLSVEMACFLGIQNEIQALCTVTFE